MKSLSRSHRPHRSVIEPLEQRRLLTTYYVNNAAGQNGSDSNNGTSLATPFLTIEKAALTALPGDVVDICAGTYRETVTPANSGTAAAPITYQAYNGQKVVIDGANIIGGWTTYGGNIYESSAMNWTMGDQNDQLFVDGQMVNFARWPNTSLDVSNPTWELAGAHTTGTVNANGTITETVYDPNLTQPAGYWTGATIHIETGETWVYEAATITNYTRAVVSGVSYGVITYTSSFNTPSFYTAGPGDPYYITGDPYFTQGQFQDLDTPGTFYRDPNTGIVYLWDPASDSPASHVIEAKARTWGFELSGLSYINITGINLFACGIDSSSNSGHLLINGINAQYVSHFVNYTGNWTPVQTDGAPVIGGTGIVLNGGNNTIENSTIAYSAGDGIFLWGNNNTVYNNIVHDVDYAGVNGAAISASEYSGVVSSNDSISFNTVFNGGRSLIDVSDMTASRIDNNQVFNAMLQAGDGAGIYGYEMNGDGTEIDHNYIYGSENNIDGFPECGIFLDVNSTGVTIDHNVVSDAVMGIKNYETQTNNILNNTVTNCATSIQIYGSAGTVENNITTSANDFSTALPSLVDTNNLQSSTNPKFVNPAAGNFQLQATSPAINAGLVIAPYTNGYIGSAPDLGAYEYGLAVWSYGASNTATVLAATAIPSPWTAADIGSPAIAGNSTYSNGVFAVTGAGSDIWNSADQFQFVSTPVSGDQTIIARVTSQGDSSGWAKAGVMFRSNASAGSPFVMVATTPGNGVNLLARDASGGLHITQASAIANPVWVKLVRSGNVFTAYDSSDGVNWNNIGSITIALPAAGLMGLAVTSRSTSQLSTAIFDNVSFPPPVVQTPSGVAATGATASSLTLAWNAASLATGYQVQRSTDGVNFSTIATLGLATSYSNSNLSADTKYDYRVIAIGSNGDSGPSSVVSASTLPAAPAGLSAVAGFVQTTLSWAAVTGAVSYDIYRATTSGAEGSTPLATGITVPAYADANVLTGVTYYYDVTAIGTAGQSAASTEVSAVAGLVIAGPPPQAPTGLSATAGVGQISLSWTAGANDATYYVYRGTSAGQESDVPIAGNLTSTSYTDTTATAGVTCYYYVDAIAAAVTSPNVASPASNEASTASLITAVYDGSFEQASVSGAYTNDPVTPYWTFAGNAGIEANGSAWNAASAPGGTQAAFLQVLGSTSGGSTSGGATTGGSISQNITVATTGTFDYIFYAAQRSGFGIDPIVVSIDGSILTTITPGSTSFSSYTTPAVNLAAGSHVLSFATTPTPASDAASFIDLVSVAVLPNASNAPSGG